MCIELDEPAMIVAMLQHFFLPMKHKMGRGELLLTGKKIVSLTMIKLTFCSVKFALWELHCRNCIVGVVVFVNQESWQDVWKSRYLSIMVCTSHVMCMRQSVCLAILVCGRFSMRI